MSKADDLIERALLQIHDLHVTLDALYDCREFLEKHNLPDVPLSQRDKISERLLDVDSHPALHTCRRPGEPFKRKGRR